MFLSVVAAEKSVATQQDPFATIASDALTYANMTPFQNEEVQISVRELARDRVKRGLQMDPDPLPRNARRPIIYRTVETPRHLE